MMYNAIHEETRAVKEAFKAAGWLFAPPASTFNPLLLSGD